MGNDPVHKLFGVGMTGAALSTGFMALVWGLDRMLGRPEITTNYVGIVRVVGACLAGAGLLLHGWTGFTLRHWWLDDRLCKEGPFRFFRHPMYAAWITFIGLGIPLLLNAWVFLLWPVMVHPLWHRLVQREEQMMESLFGEEYRTYAERTPRFVPRFRRG
jgi:protein-S-isoprenylcysteine O-methyltransferase Ste14